jgi:tellurite resistance protein TehA-like permease
LHWLAYPALAWFALGLVAYVVVLSGFDVRELVVGSGDHWIAGGALAIAALACARCAQAVATHDLRLVALAMWIAAAAWLPVLVVSELVRPRLPFHELRWSTVFPLGMYAACSFAAGAVAHVPALTEFARVWVWVAVAGWAAVVAGTARRVAA